MKKIWSYLAVGFAFFSAGIVTMYKIMGDTVKIEIKKIKTKKGSSDIDLNFDTDSARTGLKSSPKRPKRAERRAKKDGRT